MRDRRQVCVETNASGIDGQYLSGLQTCFPGSWNESSYDWFLKRPFASRVPDLFTVSAGNELIAGVGLNYRQLALPSGSLVDVGILTSAWTLPAHRGRWHFSRLIKVAASVANEKGATFLLAFVTEDNASRALLDRCGADGLPTRYILSCGAPHSLLPSTRGPMVERLPLGLSPSDSQDAVTFFYPTRNDRYSQLILRPNPTTVVRVGDNRCVLEHAEATDRLQFCSVQEDVGSLVALACRAADNGRRFFYFTSSLELGRQATERGFEVRNGQLMLLRVANGSRKIERLREKLLNSPWLTQPGDRM